MENQRHGDVLFLFKGTTNPVVKKVDSDSYTHVLARGDEATNLRRNRTSLRLR